VFAGESEAEAKAAASKKVNVPQMPTFPTFAVHRAHAKQRLMLGFRLLAKLGYDEGVAGHMTCRDPEYANLFWVNPFGIHFGQITTSSLILVDHSGNVVRGDHAVNRAAFAIHSEVHRARPDVHAACHTHSMYGKSFSALGRKLLPITQDSCAFYEDHGLYTGYGGVAYDPEEGQRIAKALGKCKGGILQNHGLITVGKTVDETVWWFISMDRCCQSQLLAEAAAKNISELKLIDHETAKDTYQIVGNSNVGWFMAQPMFDVICAEVAQQPASAKL